MEHKADIIIKLGGSIITKKNEFETINEESLFAAIELLRGITNGKCIVVHGAGSFGHFQASEYRVAHGYSHQSEADRENTKIGFCKTRSSVTRLNNIIVKYLVDGGIPAVGISPCGRWRTRRRHAVCEADFESVSSLLDEGFVPVLHGDCVLDETLGCTILSGDTIIQELCNHFKPMRVVFLSDVEGIYTRPPTEPDSQLILRILVKSDGSIATSIATTNLSHDVTGGIKLKISAACSIVKTSHGAVKVLVCKLGTESAKVACQLQDPSVDFCGTIIEQGKDDQ